MTIRIDPSKTTRVNPSLGATQQYYPCWQPSSNYAEITIDHTKLTGDVTDLVIPLTGRDLSAGFWSAVDAAGLSIVVTDAHSNRVLRRQVPYINVAGETLEVYVRVPRISATTDTDLLLSVAPYTLAQDMLTWPSSWVFASDMSDDDAGTGILDWSRSGNHGTKGVGDSAPSETDGIVAKAQSYDGINDGISTAAFTFGGQYIAASFLCTVTNAADDYWLLGEALGSGSGDYCGLYAQSGNLYWRVSTGVAGTGITFASFFGASGEYFGVPVHIVVIANYDTAGDQTFSAYRNGVLFQTATKAAGTYTFPNDNRIKAIGHWGNYSGSLLGSIDEAAIATGEALPLSADEIAAIDAALRGSATFYGVTNHF